ncbi:Probable RNA-directed DNA polymerase from transposon X-element [Eumeta japonica]|uniref:Probable RNA-directed DNA polymerase from transposon X-element n=1 Tax=Eumeta variegata TaxID=151549 RepID=A0A4C1UDU4_EUMVA|nr:Probable RNA-directed DNA polymerase from transposon X-element [Eumeta japonica]
MRPIRAGVPQGSTLSPLLYSAYACHDIRVSSFCSCTTYDILYDLQIAQKKFCRSAADAPWYVKNSVLYRDLELPTISKYMKDASERFFDVASSHPNPLLVSAVSYELPPSHHFCRRPRSVLLDPPDDLTVKVEKLIEVNRMAITS